MPRAVFLLNVWMADWASGMLGFPCIGQNHIIRNFRRATFSIAYGLRVGVANEMPFVLCNAARHDFSHVAKQIYG